MDTALYPALASRPDAAPRASGPSPLPGVQTVSYSYIGPEVTWPIYKNGTIGLAKEDLERVQRVLDGKWGGAG